jgi:rRNA maturation protein Rpf1
MSRSRYGAGLPLYVASIIYFASKCIFNVTELDDIVGMLLIIVHFHGETKTMIIVHFHGETKTMIIVHFHGETKTMIIVHFHGETKTMIIVHFHGETKTMINYVI